MSIEPIYADSWAGILKVQAEAYTDLPPEDVVVLKSKWLASPETCAVFLKQYEVLGYVLAHPWDGDSPPELYKETIINKTGKNLYLHDLALSNHGRGQGIGKKLIDNLIQKATELNFKRILLVAVQGSGGFWAKFGFMDVSNRDISPGYGKNATLMELTVRQ